MELDEAEARRARGSAFTDAAIDDRRCNQETR
jgi:hypothetical protein